MMMMMMMTMMTIMIYRLYTSAIYCMKQVGQMLSKKSSHYITQNAVMSYLKQSLKSARCQKLTLFSLRSERKIVLWKFRPFLSCSSSVAT